MPVWYPFDRPEQVKRKIDHLRGSRIHRISRLHAAQLILLRVCCHYVLQHMSHQTARANPSAHRLAVIYRPVAALKPDPRNARTHPKRQINQLVQSIREFGFTNPVLVDESVTLIAGHGRLRAAKELGLTEVPTITLEGLSEAQKKALRLADNKIALNAGWDLEILKLELDEISTIDVDFDLRSRASHRVRSTLS